MRTVGEGDGKAWIRENPAHFESKTVPTKVFLETSSRNIWDIINVTRGNEELGGLILLCQWNDHPSCSTEKATEEAPSPTLTYIHNKWR